MGTVCVKFFWFERRNGFSLTVKHNFINIWRQLLIYYITNNHLPRSLMKNKKVKLSVHETLHRQSFKPTRKYPIANQPKTLGKPIRFQQMYSIIRASTHKPTLIFDSKHSTPLQTQPQSYNTSARKLSHPRKSSLKSNPSKQHNSQRKASQGNPIMKNHTYNLINKQNLFDEVRDLKSMISQEEYKTRLLIAECRIDHGGHNHIRDSQCFLSRKEVEVMLKDIGYDLSGNRFIDLLQHLEYENYGGIPIANLKEYLYIIEQIQQKHNHCSLYEKILKKQDFEKPLKKLTSKIVTQNLQLKINEIDRKQITKFYQGWKISQKSDHLLPCLNQYKENKQENHGTFVTGFEKNREFGTSVLEPGEIKQDTFNETSNILDELIQRNHHTSMGASAFLKKSTGFENSIVEDQKMEEILRLKERINQALNLNNICPENASQVFNSTVKLAPHKNKKPILSVNVTLPNGAEQNLVVYEGESPKQVCERLASKYTLSEETRHKFQTMLSNHLKNMLWRIQQLSQELLTENE